MLKHPLHSDADALGRRTASYTANELNQYSQRTVPGVKELAGTALADATVTVNELPTIRFGPWWRHAMAPDNPGYWPWLAVRDVRPHWQGQVSESGMLPAAD